MKRKMTLLAFAVSNGGLGASGLANCAAACADFVKKPSAESNDVSAAAPKPQPVSQRNSRRVRPQKFFRTLFVIDLLFSLATGLFKFTLTLPSPKERRC